MAFPVIQYDYEFSPYGQKTRLVLTAANVVEAKRVAQPMLIPRPDLQALGITYRRIPILAIGKDVYCDTSRIIDQILASLAKVKWSPVDAAYASWGDWVFKEILGVIPTENVSKEFVEDRKSIFPILTRPDFQDLRPSALAMFHSRLRQVEDIFLGKWNTPFINGPSISIADIHIIWPVKWALIDLGVGKDPSFGRAVYPRVWRLIDSLPEGKLEDISAEEAAKLILESDYSAPGPFTIEPDDPLGLAAGTPVTIESFDTVPGVHVQCGKLIGTSAHENVLELENGIRLHFPRIGYVVKPQKSH